MATLLGGININNNIITAERPIIEDLKNMVVNQDLFFNTNHDVQGTIMRFIAPFELEVTGGAKSAIEDNGCTVDYECVGGSDFEVPLDQYINKGFAFATCPVTMLSPNAINQAYANYVKNWGNAIFKYNIGIMETGATAYVSTPDEINIKLIIEGMVAYLEAKGFDRSALVVSLNTKANSTYKKLGYTSCECNVQEPTVNEFGVYGVFNAKNNQTTDILVYVRGYALAGDYCAYLPTIFEGTEKYKNRTLIHGEIGYGAKAYDQVNAFLKHTLA